MVIFDGIFSMRGDFAPVDEINRRLEPHRDRFAGGVVTVIDDSQIVKSKTWDSYNLGAAGTDVRIGDIIEYTLTLTLQEGTIRSLTLQDTLPDGL